MSSYDVGTRYMLGCLLRLCCLPQRVRGRGPASVLGSCRCSQLWRQHCRELLMRDKMVRVQLRIVQYFSLFLQVQRMKIGNRNGSCRRRRRRRRCKGRKEIVHNHQVYRCHGHTFSHNEKFSMHCRDRFLEPQEGKRSVSRRVSRYRLVSWAC